MTDKEKEKLAIKMLNEGRATRDIHKACKISPNRLVAIRRKVNGVSPPQAMHTQAYDLFKTKNPLEVAIILGITAPEARKYFFDYLMLKGLNELLNLCTTLGPHTVTELKLLHKALARNGVNPNLYRTYARKSTRIENLKSEEEKLGQQNMKVMGENLNLNEEKERLKWEKDELKQTKEGLNEEIDYLKCEKKQLETDVSLAFDNMARLESECRELDLKKKQQDRSIKILQANFDVSLKTLIEDLHLIRY